MVSPETLKRYHKKINYQNLDAEFPFSQGYLLKYLREHYKVPAIRAGYAGDLVSLETKRQFIIWRDTGVGAEFIGLINKEVDN